MSTTSVCHPVHISYVLITDYSVYNFFNIRPVETPTIRLMDLTTTNTYSFTKAITASSLTEFLLSLLAGKVQARHAIICYMHDYTHICCSRPASRRPCPTTGMPRQSST